MALSTANISTQIRDMLAWMRKAGSDQFGSAYSTLAGLLDESTGFLRAGLPLDMAGTAIYSARDIVAASVTRRQVKDSQASTYATALRMFAAMGVGERQDVDALMRYYGMTQLVTSSVTTAQGISRGQPAEMAVSVGGARFGAGQTVLAAGSNRSRSVITGRVFQGVGS